MRWSKKKSRRSGDLDILTSREIICEAFYEGYMKWHIYQLALSKINANKNGSWMFEQIIYKEHNDFSEKMIQKNIAHRQNL